MMEYVNWDAQHMTDRGERPMFIEPTPPRTTGWTNADAARMESRLKQIANAPLMQRRIDFIDGMFAGAAIATAFALLFHALT